MLREEKWFRYSSRFYPLSVRPCGSDLYVFFAPTFWPIGITSKVHADYCSKILMQDSLYPIHADFLQEILAAGRAHLKQEIVVIKISHSALVFCGPVAQLLKLRGNSVLLYPLIGKLWRNSWPGSIYKILERIEYFHRFARPSGPSRANAYHGIDQLRNLMFLTPGKHFF